MKHIEPTSCPLCKSDDVHAYKVGWAVIHCRSCRLSLSRPMALNELIKLWNDRSNEQVVGQLSLDF